MMGPADQAYYRCTVCGHKWLHELGSCVNEFGGVTTALPAEQCYFGLATRNQSRQHFPSAIHPTPQLLARTMPVPLLIRRYRVDVCNRPAPRLKVKSTIAASRSSGSAASTGQ